MVPGAQYQSLGGQRLQRPLLQRESGEHAIRRTDLRLQYRTPADQPTRWWKSATWVLWHPTSSPILLAYNQLNLAQPAGKPQPVHRVGPHPAELAGGLGRRQCRGNHPALVRVQPLWGTGATVAQSLRPFPQYSTVDTINGQGDQHRPFHLSLHAGEVLAPVFLRPDRAGVLRAFEVADRRGQRTSGTPEDQYNRSLEKSIASYDQTHVVKLNYVYELPFGKGKPFLSARSVPSAILGGWRVAGNSELLQRHAHRAGNHRQLPHLQRRKPAHREHLRWLGRHLHGKIRSRGGQLLPAGFVVRHAAHYLAWHRHPVQPEDFATFRATTKASRSRGASRSKSKHTWTSGGRPSTC